MGHFEDTVGQRTSPCMYGYLVASDSVPQGSSSTSAAIQVKEWVQKFESRRPVLERRPPSYLPPPTEALQLALLEQQSGEVPLMDQMMDFDSRRLDLPKIPTKRRREHNAKLK